MEDQSFINKVSESGLITINLEDYYPVEDVVVFDLKDYLFMGLILKEKDFREALKQIDTEKFTNKIVTVTCSADAIIPVWAYMLVVSTLQPMVKGIYFGTREQTLQHLLLHNISKLDPVAFTDQRIVVKGCGELPIPESVYFEITKILRPVVKSIMYGEPCSTVPVYKKK